MPKIFHYRFAAVPLLSKGGLPTAAIKSICEPKMIVAKKLVTRQCRANSHRQKDNVKMIKQTDRHAG